MKPPIAKVIALFVLAGLCSGLITTLLGLVYVLFLFLAVGLIFLAAAGAAYGICLRRRWLPAAATRGRYLGAGATLMFCYPIGIYLGVLLAFVSEAVLWLLLPASWFTAMRGEEPLPLMALLMFWGAMIVGFMVAVALAVITERWDNRVFVLLLVAGMLTTAVTLTVYVPVFYSADPLVVRYRESIYFALMVPLGDMLFAGLLGYGLVRAAPVEAAGFRPAKVDSEVVRLQPRA